MVTHGSKRVKRNFKELVYATYCCNLYSLYWKAYKCLYLKFTMFQPKKYASYKEFINKGNIEGQG